jgi:hypothetical protein
MADIDFFIPVCLSKAIQDWQEKNEIATRLRSGWLCSNLESANTI